MPTFLTGLAKAVREWVLLGNTLGLEASLIGTQLTTQLLGANGLEQYNQDVFMRIKNEGR